MFISLGTRTEFHHCVPVTWGSGATQKICNTCLLRAGEGENGGGGRRKGKKEGEKEKGGEEAGKEGRTILRRV